MQEPLDFERITEKFSIRTGFGSVALSLLELPIRGRILVMEPGNDIAEFIAAEGHEAIHIRTSDPLEQAVFKVQQDAPYVGAILVPQFGSAASRVPPPPGWDIGKAYTEDILLAYAISNLKPIGSLVAIVSYGLLTGYTRRLLRRTLVEHGLSAVVSLYPGMLSENKIQIQTGLIVVHRRNTDQERAIVFLDLVNFVDLPNSEDFLKLIYEPSFPIDPSERVTIDIHDLSGDFRLDPQYYDPAYLRIKPPAGYSDFALGEIADIRGGIGVYETRERFEHDPENGTPYCQVRHILDNGDIADNVLWLKRQRVSEDETGWARPGDILVTVAGTIGKLAIVPPRFSRGVFFDTSIRRIRVDPEYAAPEAVYNFLRSDIGQLQFRRMTSGTVIPQVTSPALATIRVFLPPPAEVSLQDTAHLAVTQPATQADIIANALQTEVIDYLKQVQAQDTNWQLRIREKLQQFLDNLLPKSLDKAILEEFPAPIAIPYRRFKAARYNNYERIDRLVALVECCIYFVFHVLLADYFRNKWQSSVSLSNDARAALKGDDSIDHRLKFIDETIQAIRNGVVVSFMPQIADTSIITVGNLIREKVRNPTAHSAPGAEPRVKLLIEQHWPHVEKLLDELRFLSAYTMCQINSHSYHNGRWWYQATVYKGAEYDINIEEFALEPASGQQLQFIEAERDHLVIVNAAYETLDMFPFYQVHLGDETGLEPHLCFFKRCFTSASEIRGESVRSGIEVKLQGYDEFRSLISSS